MKCLIGHTLQLQVTQDLTQTMAQVKWEVFFNGSEYENVWADNVY